MSDWCIRMLLTGKRDFGASVSLSCLEKQARVDMQTMNNLVGAQHPASRHESEIDRYDSVDARLFGIEITSL
jgi:hypothetical protein